MIYLITGNMGTGKTSLAVDWILNNYDGLFQTTAEDGTKINRPLYFCHIDGLDKQKFKAHELDELQIQSSPLHELVPEGSVVIVDECDYTYPLMAAGKDVPPYIKTLKELRHYGLTLILMTQHPSMLNSYLRRLVSKHIHLERKTVGTKKYEFFRAEENLNASTFGNTPSEFYSPSKESHKYFKSASKHIKFNKKRHWALYVAPIAFLIVLWRGYAFFDRFDGEEKSKPVDQVQVVQPSQPQVSEKPVEVSETEKIASAPEIPLGGKVSDYQPRVPSLPETKPIYDSLRTPVNMETVVGCVKSKNSCNCYTEQATTVYTSREMCVHWAENGVFQVYRNVAQEFSAAPVPLVEP